MEWNSDVGGRKEKPRHPVRGDGVECHLVGRFRVSRRIAAVARSSRHTRKMTLRPLPYGMCANSILCTSPQSQHAIL